MATFSNPSEIAREALRLLAVRRMSPSPANYRDLYDEIAGTSSDLAEGFPESELKALLASLPNESPVQQKLARRFQHALKGKNWAELLKEWLKLVPCADRFKSVEGEVVTLQRMSAEEYVDSDPLDLDYLSSRAG